MQDFQTRYSSIYTSDALYVWEEIPDYEDINYYRVLWWATDGYLYWWDEEDNYVFKSTQSYEELPNNTTISFNNYISYTINLYYS